MVNCFNVIFFCSFLPGLANVASAKVNVILENHRFANQLFAYFNETSVSEECRKTFAFYKTHREEKWAIEIIDSSGSIPPGVTRGNLQFLGNFDECLDISEVFHHNEVKEIHGQYCTLTISMNSLMGGNDFNLTKFGLDPTIGICMVSACSLDDLTKILKTYSNHTGFNIKPVYCTTSQHPQVKLHHIIIICIFCSIALLLVIATAFDGALRCGVFRQNHSQSTTRKAILAFSVYSNTEMIFGTDNNKSTIACFNGFRLVSILFIILYHTYTEAQLPSANIFDIFKNNNNFLLQIITNAGLWVDSFFLLSGFLAAYGTIQECRRASIRKYNPFKKLLHRYFRLTPSLAGVIAYSILQEVLGSGPLWYQYVEESENTCHKWWWLNLLYVNNIFKLNTFKDSNTECLPFTWYLAVDMQLFLVSPILILGLAHHKPNFQKCGILLNGVIILLSCFFTASLMMVHKLTPTVLVSTFDANYINLIYKQSYCRIGPYSVGILMAYFYLKYKGNVAIKPIFNLIGWLVSFFLIALITFLTWPWLTGSNYQNLPSVFYGAFHRTIWALAWAYILFACSTSHGGFFNRLLSWPALAPLSRLSYQAYLYHSVIISLFVHGARTASYSSNINLIMTYFQYVTFTMIISYFASMAFEFPFLKLEKIIFGVSFCKKRAKLNSRNKNETNETTVKTTQGTN